MLEKMKHNLDKRWNSPNPVDAEAVHDVSTSFDFLVVVNVVTGLLDCTMSRHLQEKTNRCDEIARIDRLVEEDSHPSL